MRLVSFNLLDEPWLPVVRLDGSADEMGLVLLLREAHMLRRIVGDLSNTERTLVGLQLRPSTQK